MKYDFLSDIVKFNDMYKIQSNDKPTNLGFARIEQFHDILTEELKEADAVAGDLEVLGPDDKEETLEALTGLADLLGDVIVYCASEARRWGIPLEGVLKLIMESNFSKLGVDGKPIYDERNKVMKGPGYWKPEAAILELLKLKVDGK